MTLGNQICKFRTEKRMSQEDLAKVLDVSCQSINDWENDVLRPDPNALLTLSKQFNISLDTLIRVEHGQEHHFEAVPIKSNERNSIAFALITIGALFSYLFWPSAPVFVTAYLLLAGILCLFIQHHLALVLGWIAWLDCTIFFTTCTSVRLQLIFSPDIYSSMKQQMIIAYILWISCILLIILTACLMIRFRNYHLHKK